MTADERAPAVDARKLRMDLTGGNLKIPARKFGSFDLRDERVTPWADYSLTCSNIVPTRPQLMTLNHAFT